jgi:endonuclease V-like protein UPF0215 family
MLTSFKDFGRSATLDDLYNIASGSLNESIVFLTEEDRRIIEEIRDALMEAPANTPHDTPEEDDSEDVPAEDPYKKANRQAAKPVVTAKPAVAAPTAKQAVTKPVVTSKPAVIAKPTVATKPQATQQKPLPKGTKVIDTTPRQVVRPGGTPLTQKQLDDRGMVALKARISKSNQKWKDFTSNAKELIGANSKTVSPTIMTPGMCYFFKYRSKLYDKMEIDFYEQNPIIICIEKKPKVILGLNFHYLSPAERKEIVRKLNIPTSVNTKKLSTMITNWSIAKSVLGENRAKRMLKAYLPNRISECYALVPYHLHVFADLDMSNFTSDVTKTYVWKDWQNLKRNKFNLSIPAAPPKPVPKQGTTKPVVTNKPTQQPAKKTK